MDFFSSQSNIYEVYDHHGQSCAIAAIGVSLCQAWLSWNWNHQETNMKNEEGIRKNTGFLKHSAARQLRQHYRRKLNVKGMIHQWLLLKQNSKKPAAKFADRINHKHMDLQSSTHFSITNEHEASIEMDYDAVLTRWGTSVPVTRLNSNWQ